MGFKSIILAGAFALSVFAAPIPDCPEDDTPAAQPTPTAQYTPVAQTTPSIKVANAGSLTAENLIAISSNTASCAGAPFPEECADATQAAAAFNTAFSTYGVTSAGEKAAVIAYTLFESGDFKYSKNHFPGRPGQGTRMMAMPPFVKLYATAVAGTASVAAAEAAGGDAGLNAVLALVNSDDEKSFGSAAWFLTTQCTPDVRAGLAAETVDGWHNFLTTCVGTTAAAERDVPWTAAKQIILE